MPIIWSWDNDEKTVLLEKYEGRWTVEEYQRLVDDVAEICAQVPHTVHIISDATNAPMPPVQLLVGIQYAIKKIPPNMGILVFVKLNRIMNMFVDFGRQISPRVAQSTYAADTLEEARRLIAEKGPLFKQLS